MLGAAFSLPTVVSFPLILKSQTPHKELVLSQLTLSGAQSMQAEGKLPSDHPARSSPLNISLPLSRLGALSPPRWGSGLLAACGPGPRALTWSLQ